MKSRRNWSPPEKPKPKPYRCPGCGIPWSDHYASDKSWVPCNPLKREKINPSKKCTRCGTPSRLHYDGGEFVLCDPKVAARYQARPAFKREQERRRMLSALNRQMRQRRYRDRLKAEAKAFAAKHHKIDRSDFQH